MTRLIVDAAMRDKLRNTTTVLEVCDEAGQTLGHFHPAPPAKRRSPFSDEEIERFRQEQGGRSLAEILKDLGAT